MQSSRLGEIVASALRLPPSEIDDTLDMESTSTWDSLSHMELIAAIEDEFSIELSADEIVSMRSVGDIKRVLAAHGAQL